MTSKRKNIGAFFTQKNQNLPFNFTVNPQWLLKWSEFSPCGHYFQSIIRGHIVANSLMDQLKKAGLVDKKKGQQAKKAKQKKDRMKRNSNIKGEDQIKQLAKQAELDKKERDRQLNQQKEQEAENIAIIAQIKQLIESHRIEGEGDIVYNFTHDNKIKRIYVTEKMQKQLGAGHLAIVTLDERYEVVPYPIAEKISQRDEERVIFSESSNDVGNESGIDEDDPYAEHQIPDDLMW